MVGGNREETGQNVGRAFQEFGRVLKPGGLLFVFEMTPSAIFGLAQNLLWNSVRRLVPAKLDMYFWSAGALAALGARCLPPGTVGEKIFFGTSPFTVIPPIFSLPWFQVPRFIYPLDAKLYKWRMPGSSNGQT
jgi:hypothetical protein